MSDGVLSQAISNIQQLAATVNGFSGLPPQAIAIQQNIVAQLNTELPQIMNFQQQTLTTGVALQGQLNTLIANLHSQSTEQLNSAILQIQTEITPLAQRVNQTLVSCQNMDASVTQNNLAIQKISMSLQTNIVALQASLANANQEVNALNKKKLYLLSLGVLGLPGLITLAVLMSKAQDEVNTLNGQINQLQMNIKSQQGFLTQAEALSSNIDSMVNKISQSGNAISFLKGDIGNVSQDISAGTLSQLQLYLSAALIEVNTLIIDAS